LPRCQALAADIQRGARRFKWLNATQLLKHALGLANRRAASRRACATSTTTGRGARPTRSHGDRCVRAAIDAAPAFAALSYQTLFAALSADEAVDRATSTICARATSRSRAHERRSLTSPFPPARPSSRPRKLAAFGAADVAVSRGGVACAGSLEVAYRACLWSRVANRVLLARGRFDAPTPDALYAGVRTIDWSEHLSVDGTLAVDAVSQRSAITHTQFAALKVKDAVVDQFRDREGRRPSVDVAAPDVQLNLYIDRDRATLSVDLSGDSLHRRGYRGPQGAAPLKENLAAAVLLRAGWQKLAAGATAESRVGFVDPMCGSGTLAIEAALIAGDVAPGSLRERFGFSRWRGHDAALWRRLLDEAAERRAAARLEHFDLRAYDRSAAAVSAARANAAAAGLAAHVRVERSELDDLPAAPLERGLSR